MIRTEAIALSAALLAWGGAAEAQTTSPYAEVPHGEILNRYYPAAARERGIEGRSVLSCRVEPGGTVSGCSVVEESPPGSGFGLAAVRAARLFRLNPDAARSSLEQGGEFTLRIAWQLPEEEGEARVPCFARQLNSVFAEFRLSRRERGRLLDAWADHLRAQTGPAGLPSRRLARGFIEQWLPATRDADPQKLAYCRSNHPGPPAASGGR